MMKHYTITERRIVGEVNKPIRAYRVRDNGDVQHLWRGGWVNCAYFCEEELIADGAEINPPAQWQQLGQKIPA